MRCIIIEDQPPAQRILHKYIEDLGSLELVGTFGDAIKGLEFLKEQEVDLIFLDIHLPKLSGIDFLKTLHNPPFVILTTAFPDFALESYDLDVVDYLLKPFSFARFVKAVSKIPKKETVVPRNTQEDNHIFIKSGHEFFKININDILFIKADHDYTEIVLVDKKHLSVESLKHWLDYLGDQHMIRVHKSYIVNKIKIKKIASTSISIGYDIKIPVGRAYKDEVIKLINHLNTRQL